jgi:hypothetical protein
MAGFAMLMRMEPAGRRTLVGRKVTLRLPPLDDALRSTVDFTRHFQPVPVQSSLRERVVDIHRHRFPFT